MPLQVLHFKTSTCHTCTDVIDMEGNRFKKLQVFMDITPVFAK